MGLNLVLKDMLEVLKELLIFNINGFTVIRFSNFYSLMIIIAEICSD